MYCFLSTCLGVQIRRSDIWEAIRSASPDTPSAHGYRRYFSDRNYPDNLQSATHLHTNEAIEMASRGGSRYA